MSAERPEKMGTRFDGTRTWVLVDRWRVGVRDARLNGAGWDDDVVIHVTEADARADYEARQAAGKRTAFCKQVEIEWDQWRP